MVDILVHTHVLAGFILLVPAVAWGYLFVRRLEGLTRERLIAEAEVGDVDQGRKLDNASRSDTKTMQTLGDMYALRYIPEPNTTVLQASGIYFVVNSMIGYTILTITEIPYGMSLLSDTFHFLLYGLLGGPGIVYLLEARQVVPPDSGRVSHAVAWAFGAFLVYVHAGLKETEDDVLQHALIALTEAICSLSLFVSVFYPSCILAYAVYLLSLAWQGLWWMSMGFRFLIEGVSSWDDDYEDDEQVIDTNAVVESTIVPTYDDNSTLTSTIAPTAASSDDSEGDDDWYGDAVENVMMYFSLEGIALFAIGLGIASHLYQLSRKRRLHEGASYEVAALNPGV